MNFYQLIQLFLIGYTQDDIVSAVILKYKEIVGTSISVTVVRNRLSQPISEYKSFTEYFNDTLCAVAGVNVRTIIDAKLKEVELV